jgi:SAM-dependent methyltransferase
VTESDYLRLTRDGYDRTAGAYADRFHDHLRDKPLDLAMLSGFAGLVGAGGDVADVGCGTGATTAMLTDAGLDAVGIDLSPNMIEQARRLNPALTFHVGAMAALPFDDGALAGVCAWYSTIHVPDEELPQVFSEFARVLRPGGYVLVAFQVGDQPRVLAEAFGERVSLTFYRRRPDAVAGMLDAAGLKPYAQLVRELDDDGLESTPQAYLIGRKY